MSRKAMEDFCWRCGKRSILKCVEPFGFLCRECLSDPASTNSSITRT